MKKLMSLLLCLLLIFSMTAPAYAAEGEDPVQTVTDTDTDSGDSDDSGDSGDSESEQTPPAHTHDWGSGTVTTAATCTADGVKTYTCACGESKTEAISASGHSFSEWFQGKSVHERTCSACGEVEGGEHSMSASVTTAPTCKDTGVQTNACTVCGYSYTETVPVSSTHTYGEWDGDESGHFRSCTVCGAEDSGSHAWADEVVTVPATCLEEGATAQVCTVCGGALVGVLPKLTTHTYTNVCDPECNVCGATRDTAHKFSTVWSKNYKEHWHACTLCGEKSDTADHYPGPAATEEKDQICLTCGYVMTPKIGHTHKYSAQWSSDEAGHWYGCDGCEDQKDYAFHEYDDLCDPDCNICGYEPPTAHSFSENWETDETGHWTSCVLCGEVKETEAHTADPDTPEGEALLCTVCGYEIAPAQEHVHEAGEDWVGDAENHWKTCDCGEELDKAPHAWDEGTENEDTTITYTCTECGAEKTEGEPKEPSSFPLGWILAGLIAIAAGLAVALVFLLRSGKK